MPLNIPKVISNLIVGNDPSQRLFQGVVNAVNPLLGFVNSTFQTLADGTLQIQRSISVQGNSTVTGSQTTTGTSTSGGQVVNGSSRIVGPSVVVGSQVIQKYPDGTAGGQLVQGNQTVLGNTSSATGFKGFGPIFTYNGSISAGAYINMGIAGTGANMPHKYPFAGSVVGCSISFYCSATTSTLNFYITGSTGDILNTYGPNNYTGAIWFYNAYAKGQYSFPANGDLICKVYSPTAISSIQLIIAPLLEFNA